MMRVLAPPQGSELVERGVVGPEETHHEEGTVLRLYMNSGKRGGKKAFDPLQRGRHKASKLSNNLPHFALRSVQGGFTADQLT